MIDFHSHILPQMDDGSQSLAESLALLQMLQEQGVSTVAATPHFYANHESVEKFLQRRAQAYERLISSVPPTAPKIVLGAEVKYYEGISHLENLNQLKIQGTNLLLLEMPFSKWSAFAFRELIDLVNLEDTTILLAHIERYLKFVSADQLAILRNYGVLIQVNASFFLKLKTKRKALRMLKNHEIHLLGSDCHNIAHRPPMLLKAQEMIEKKLGVQALESINHRSESLFEVAKISLSL